MTRDELARMIDHTQVRANATQRDITRLCEEAVQHGFAGVAINPIWTSYCAKRLKDTGVAVNPTVGFPLGANTATIKVREAQEAAENGATEIDMVINIGAIKSGFPQYVEREIKAVVGAVPGIPVKVILETAYLTNEEKVVVCKLAADAGAAFVKTSTGYAGAGATVEDVALMRRTVGNVIGVKAAGGIRGYLDAMAMIEAGATRIGTSAGVTILGEIPAADEVAQ